MTAAIRVVELTPVLAATAIMVLGICVTAVVSQSSGYRLGGVMVLPLLAVYTFREPVTPVAVPKPGRPSRRERRGSPPATVASLRDVILRPPRE